MSDVSNDTVLVPGSFTPRTLGDRFGEVVNVVDFGADRTGGADATGSINAALARVPSTGGCVWFPPGSYQVSNVVSIGGNNTFVAGIPGASIISTSSPGSDIFSITGNFVSVYGLSFTSSITRSAGHYISVTSPASRIRLEKLHMENAFVGIYVNNVSSLTIDDTFILSCVAGTGVGVYIDGGFDLRVTKLTMDASSQIQAGIFVSSCGDLSIDKCAIMHGGNALFVAPGPNQVCASIYAQNSFFDTSGTGVYLLGNGGVIGRCRFIGCWSSSATGNGFLAATSNGGQVDGILLNGHQAFLNSANGIAFADGGCKNVMIEGCQTAQNGLGGITLSGPVSGFIIDGNMSGAGYGGFSGNADGIFLEASCSNGVVKNNVLIGNGTNLAGQPQTNVIIGDNIFG